jgi:enoyl-[acyl-carrier protein] reductase / trans-2-enoyl-CoA reductase (NAD+)
MVARVLRPQGKGFIFLDSHPAGCAATVDAMIDEATRDRAGAAGPGDVAGRSDGAGQSDVAGPTSGARPRALVVACSAGYGLATAVAGLFGYGARVIGLCFERAATPRRSASAGWYRIATLADRAADAGLAFEPVSGDCFDPAIRAGVLDRAAAVLGQVDVLIYSVAAPRRTDPLTGAVYRSAVKPIGAVYETRNVAFADGVVLRESREDPATEAEIDSTVKVMGGEDWATWVTDLAERGLLAPGFQTAALTYVGSELTAPIYRLGTIGRAKDHLEATAAQLTDGVLAKAGGTALTSVHSAAVTMSSLAIPGISLYLSLLHSVAGETAESAVRQSMRLWDHLTGRDRGATDAVGRLRLDNWELAADVQAELRSRWQARTDELMGGLADLDWFRRQIWQLYGFDVPGVDYSQPVEVDVPWPVRLEQMGSEQLRSEQLSSEHTSSEHTSSEHTSSEDIS